MSNKINESAIVVTVLFIIYLLVLVGLLYTLFYGYSKLSGNFLGNSLKGLGGGYILFLAANEILALPFLIFHLPFAPFLLCFLALNIPMLIYGAAQLIKRKGRNKLPIPNLLGFLALGIVLVCTFITMVYVKYDADDSYYISAIRQNIDSNHLYKTDPSTGDPSLPSSHVYRFEAWELIESALSYTLRIEPVVLAHSLMPLLLIPLVFLIHRNIFKYFLKNDKEVNYATIALGLFFLFSGYSLYSQGTFLLTRVWQGKAILATLIIPLLLFIFYRLYFEKNDRKKFYASIFIINIASVCLNPAAIYINVALIAVFGILILYRNRRLKEILSLFISSLPLVLAGVGILLFSSQNEKSGLTPAEKMGSTDYIEYLDRFIGSSLYFYIYAIILLFAVFNTRNRSFLLFGIFPLFLFLTFLNPLLFEPVKSYITANTYWRLLWLIPISIFIPIFASVTLRNLASITSKKLYFASAALIAILIMVSGTFMFDTSKPFVAYDRSQSKVPPGVEDVAKFMEVTTNGNVLATTNPAAYLHNFTTNHVLIVSRELYLPVHFSRSSSEYVERQTLMKIIEGREKELDAGELQHLLNKYEVDYLIFSTNNYILQGFVMEHKYQEIYKNSDYTIVEI